MVGTYIALSAVGVVTIGGVVLEKHLMKNDKVAASRLLSDGLYHGVRLSGIAFIGYVFIRIVMMF
ncbi:hypothetical protein BAMA_18485 [Bacillus manliponensis]|uniref:Uncharacterized protein n=1 Tax=Bacillus manliponensis TaxID=574376 RepID=A0A073JS90_9BACI|nr:hypothetical protein [Bacillus manliponensis]KEK17127.1 hypothetical protein BAMA_18485 [Bacillus manliponensis]